MKNKILDILKNDKYKKLIYIGIIILAVIVLILLLSLLFKDNEKYIYDYIKSGNNINFDIDLKSMYTENEKEMILDAISRFGDEKVSAIKKVMPDYVKYESIRAVILENYINKD